MTTPSAGFKKWKDLPSEERVQLQIAFGHYADRLPRTCSLEAKVERFRSWLADRGIRFDKEF